MRISAVAALVIVVALAAVAVVSEGTPVGKGFGRIALDDLSTSKADKFPRRWRSWPFHRGNAAKVYKVAIEGGSRFIRAYDEWNLSEQIFLNFTWNVKERPMLSWRWRAGTLPAGAKESNGAKNDSACGLYVVVGRYKGHAIKYVWSTTLPAGTVVTRREGKLKIKVLDSGSSKAGSWVNHKVNVPEDYKALFGHDLGKNPSGIGLLTDGNAVEKPSGCDYAGFAISGES